MCITKREKAESEAQRGKPVGEVEEGGTSSRNEVSCAELRFKSRKRCRTGRETGVARYWHGISFTGKEPNPNVGRPRDPERRC